MADTTLRQAFSDIADAIRAKGVTGTMSPLQMPTKVASISSSKYGVSVDSVLGNVDQNGVLQAPSQQFQFVSSEIREIGGSGVKANALLNYKFYFNTALTSVSLPNLTTVSGAMGMTSAFQGCTSLTTVNMPNLTAVSGTFGLSNAFNGCTSLTTVYLSKLSNTNLGSTLGGVGSTFSGCTALELVDFSQATAVPEISTNTFNNTNSTFQIVVPDSLYSSWTTATNWSALSSQIVRVSDYTPAS